MHSYLAAGHRAREGVPHSQGQGVGLQEGPVGVHMALQASAAAVQAVQQQVPAALAQVRKLARAAPLLLVLLRAAQMQALLMAQKQQEELPLLALLQQQLLLSLTEASRAACGLPLLLHLRLAWWRAWPAWPGPPAALACPAGTARHAQPP